MLGELMTYLENGEGDMTGAETNVATCKAAIERLKKEIKSVGPVNLNGLRRRRSGRTGSAKSPRRNL